jgi:hypothetical protein
MMIRTGLQWRWWMAAPLLVVVLTFWCQLHGLSLGHGPVSFGISAPWALEISAGWILAGALLARWGGPLSSRPFAQRRPWMARALLVAGIVTLTLVCEAWLLRDGKLLSLWLYERVPVHLTFAMLMLGGHRLWQHRQVQAAPVAVPVPVVVQVPPAAPTMLEVLTGTGRTRVRLDEVECLEADRNYINVHTGERSYLLRQTLASVEKSLCSADFQRIHRSTIVNRAKIRERRRGGVLVLCSGRTVRISRAFADRVH